MPSPLAQLIEVTLMAVDCSDVTIRQSCQFESLCPGSAPNIENSRPRR